MSRRTVLFSLIIASIALYIGCTSNTVSTKKVASKGQYVGSVNCESCHQEAYGDWQASHHYQSMLEPNAESVLADFSQRVVLDDVTYQFSIIKGVYHVETIDHSDTNLYRVKYTFGFKPLQQFLIEFPDGKLQTLRATWDSENNRWFHQYSGDVISPNDWLHWSNQGQNWNSMCADCHSTDLKKNLNPLNGHYETSFSEINVSCETCHGPGSNHVNWANAESLETNGSGLFEIAKNNVERIEKCAPCHSRRSMMVQVTRFNKPFYDQFYPQVISDIFYEPDGQIKEEDYVYSSFASSKMYHQNVDCMNCHNPHSNELKLEGNKLCGQCHVPAYDSPAHHFHEIDTEAALCINCHMDGKTYMGNDYRRDHSFRVPRPDQSVKYNTSNACISCHDTESNEWAEQWVESWYGEERALHFSDLLLAGNIDHDISALLALVQDTAFPGIARAAGVGYLSDYLPAEYESVLFKLSKAEEPIIRLELLTLLSMTNSPELLSISARLLGDSYRTVRIAAFRNLVNDYESLTLDQRADWLDVEKEYKVSLDFNADFKEGQAQISEYELSKGNNQAAIYALEKSIGIDSLFAEPYINLAILYSQEGYNEKAFNVLNDLIKFYPEDDYAYYLRAILNAEMSQLADAALDLKKAIELRPTAQYYYNYILVNKELGRIEQARKIRDKARDLFPNDLRLKRLN